MMEQTLLDREIQLPKNGEEFDLIIIGSGPAGMSAALCARRDHLKTLIIEKALPGGQASTAYTVQNVLGYPAGISGDELAKRMEEHVTNTGIYYAFEAVEDILNVEKDIKTVKTELGNFYTTRGIIIAAGLEPKQMNLPFEKQFLGRGISYYASADAEIYAGKDVAVIGGGNCACYAAEFLSSIVNRLYIVHKNDHIKAVKDLQDKIMQNPRIDILWNSDLEDVFGLDKVEKIKVRNIVTGQHTWIDVKAVFVYVGRIPSRQILSVHLETDEEGYIITDNCMRTNLRGIYAAGDIRSKQIRQITTAVNDGMIAAINAQRDLFR